MVLAVSWTKELSTIAFDNDTASELQRPAATFEAHGLTFDTATPLNRRIDNQAELDACLQNVVRIARHLRQQAEERQMNMPRLYAEFITAFLTQRQQLEMIFVHTRVTLREGRVPDAAWTQTMQVMTWKTRSSQASQADLHTLVNRAALPFESRRDAPPIFIPSKFRSYRAVTTKHPTITVSDFISDGQSTTYTSQMLLSASVKAMKLLYGMLAELGCGFLQEWALASRNYRPEIGWFADEVMQTTYFGNPPDEEPPRD
ncbi:hypothetical protein DL769_001566 [Monosporascus sp. CRB-8-3]|nr:hypothetical protein DL769_001566 [Monosporascus sp. CRB-8-3]